MLPTSFEQFESTEEEIGSALGNLKTSYWEAQGANVASAWDFNPTSSLFRVFDQVEAYQESNVYLNKDELNKQYAGMGLRFEEDTREGVVQYLVSRKQIEMERASILSRGPKNAYGTFFLTSMATNFADPINIASAFVPVVGQARFANMVARSGKNVARLKRGFVEGFVGNAAVEPIVYGVARSEQADYDQYDAFFNIAVGGVLGSTMHISFGKIGDIVAEKTNKPNIYQKLAAVSPENQQELLKYSIGKVLRGEKIDTEELIKTKTRIGDEQLSRLEDQIGEYKTLYQDALNRKDVTSAKVYLDNLRNLQKTELDLIEAKRQSNDLATQKNRSDDNIRLENQPSPELNAIYKDKNTPEILMEAENFSQRLKLQQKQFGIKDEDLSVDVQEGYKQIEILDNLLSKKTTIKETLNGGINCVIRSLGG
jgi:hypothetical protein